MPMDLEVVQRSAPKSQCEYEISWTFSSTLVSWKSCHIQADNL